MGADQDRVGCGLGDTDVDGLVVEAGDQAVKHVAAHARQPIGAAATAEAEAPGRADLLPVLDHPRLTRWTSTRNERLETISSTSAGREVRLRRFSALRAPRRRMTATVAAPATKPVAATAAAWTAGRAARGSTARDSARTGTASTIS